MRPIIQAVLAMALIAGAATTASAQTYGSGATTNCPVENCKPGH